MAKTVLKLLLPSSLVTRRRLLNGKDEEETDAEHGPQSKKEDMIFSWYRALICVFVVWCGRVEERKDYLRRWNRHVSLLTTKIKSVSEYEF